MVRNRVSGMISPLVYAMKACVSRLCTSSAITCGIQSSQGGPPEVLLWHGTNSGPTGGSYSPPKAAASNAGGPRDQRGGEVPTDLVEVPRQCGASLWGGYGVPTQSQSL